MPHSNFHETAETSAGAIFRRPQEKPTPGAAASHQAQDPSSVRMLGRPADASLPHTRESMSREYTAELEAWARQAAAANGFGDLP